jgi:hypothetical protein
MAALFFALKPSRTLPKALSKGKKNLLASSGVEKVCGT